MSETSVLACGDFHKKTIKKRKLKKIKENN
jgi:hypothetical protein